MPLLRGVSQEEARKGPYSARTPGESHVRPSPGAAMRSGILSSAELVWRTASRRGRRRSSTGVPAPPSRSR